MSENIWWAIPRILMVIAGLVCVAAFYLDARVVRKKGRGKDENDENDETDDTADD